MKRKYRSGEFALTENQVGTFLGVITDIRDLALFQIALAGGLRRLDIVGINKQDIDLEKKTLTFYENKKRRIKTIYLPQKVCNTVEMVFNAFSKEKSKKLFPISDKTAYNRFQKYLERAGISGRPFHSLRATCTKLCQAKGWSAEQTAALVGDKVSTIQEHYLTPSDEEMRAMSDSNSII
jgi:integrase